MKDEHLLKMSMLHLSFTLNQINNDDFIDSIENNHLFSVKYEFDKYLWMAETIADGLIGFLVDSKFVHSKCSWPE